jgi:hypothetical protein
MIWQKWHLGIWQDDNGMGLTAALRRIPMASTFSDRMLRAARLEPDLYEEVEADKNALGQAMGVVVLVSIAAGLGAAHYGSPSIIIGTLAALIGWFVWAALIYGIGAKWLPEPQTRTDMGELLRTLGFSASPGLIRLFGFIPILGPLIFLIGNIWMLGAMVIAVRQALDYTSTGRAIAVCFIGWLVEVAILAILLMAAR